jgi:hypothetical protein
MTTAGHETISDMKARTVRLPDDLDEWLTRWAESEKRTVNAQLEWLLERTRREIEHREEPDRP